MSRLAIDDDEMTDDQRDAMCNLGESLGLTGGEAEDLIDEYLEAMAAGTPVVAANTSALPEVTGGAAILVDPLDPEDIADGLERAIAERDVMIPIGRRRAAEFTWARTAALTVDAYRERA